MVSQLTAVINMNRAVSLERIKQYLTIEQEAKPTDRGVPPAYWPASGSLTVEKLSARYSVVRHEESGRVYVLMCAQDGPEVLHEVSFEVKSGERVGIGKLHS